MSEQGIAIDIPGSGADRAIAHRALDDAFGYRGDVTLELLDGSVVEGYVFDRRPAPTLDASIVRIIPRESQDRMSIPYAKIRRVIFSGKDPAAGKTWENWLKRYAEKKMRGEAAGIDSEPID